jgi:hypothetical protein
MYSSVPPEMTLIAATLSPAPQSSMIFHFFLRRNIDLSAPCRVERVFSFTPPAVPAIFVTVDRRGG